MSALNTPSDWHDHWTECDRGHRYHASEGSCEECELIDEALRMDGEDMMPVEVEPDDEAEKEVEP